MGKNCMMNNFTFNTLALTIGSILLVLSICIALNVEVIISISIIVLALIISSELRELNIRLRSNGEVNPRFIKTTRRLQMVL